MWGMYYYYAVYREIFLRTYFRNIMNVLYRIAGFFIYIVHARDLFLFFYLFQRVRYITNVNDVTRWEKCWEILSRLKNVQKPSFVALNRVLLIDLSTFFFHFLMDKLRKIRRLLWKDRLWANNIAKRESDLLKTNEANLPPPRQP